MSIHKCDKCEKYIKPDPASFKVGDSVTFTVTSTNGRSVRMKAVDGKVVHAEQNTLVVEHRKNQTLVKRTAVTLKGAPSPLTYQLFGVCSCAT